MLIFQVFAHFFHSYWIWFIESKKQKPKVIFAEIYLAYSFLFNLYSKKGIKNFAEKLKSLIMFGNCAYFDILFMIHFEFQSNTRVKLNIWFKSLQFSRLILYSDTCFWLSVILLILLTMYI